MPHGVPDREALQDEQHGLDNLFGQEPVEPEAEQQLGELENGESEDERVEHRHERVFSRRSAKFGSAHHGWDFGRVRRLRKGCASVALAWPAGLGFAAGKR